MIYGYARVSTQEQADGTSLATQERRVMAVAAFRGEDMHEFMAEAGVSGSVPLSERPVGAALLQRLKRGDTVIVSKLDRMFRDAHDALRWFNHFQKHGIDLILCDMGTEPVTQNGVSKMFFTMLAAMAEFERERINERTEEGRKAKRRAGGWMGGRPPFGYIIEGVGKHARCVPDPAFADALKYLRWCYDNSISLRVAADGVSQKHGLRVSEWQVRRIYGRFDNDCTTEDQRDDGRASEPRVSLETPIP